MKEEKQKNGFLHNFLTVVGIVLCVILIPMLAMNITLLLKSVLSEDVPSFGGYLPQIVLTDSMNPEFYAGDLIICHTADAEDIQVGDVISFFDPSGNGTSIVTHRVIEITETADGELTWVTQGDANNTADAEPVPEESLVAVWDGIRIPKAGNAAMFMQTTQGLILCVLVPLVLLVSYDLIRRRIYEKNNRQDTQALMAELEQLRAAKAAQEQPEDKTPPAES